MFNFLKKTKKEKFIIPDVKISTVIVSLAETYVECKTSESFWEEESEPNLEKEYERLKSLGLANTKNAKLLETKLNEFKQKKRDAVFGKKVIEYIKDLVLTFPSPYLISFEQFRLLLKKYKLTTNFLREYCGVIPADNILEIEKITKILEVPNNLWINRTLNGSGHHIYFRYVSGIDYSISTEKLGAELVRDKINELGRIFDFGTESVDSWTQQEISLRYVKEITDKFPNGLDTGHSFSDFRLITRPMYSADLMIAAPENCFSEKFEVSYKPTDPIVFQYCPFGVIIHSVWGEEADDKVLEKYREFSKKF